MSFRVQFHPPPEPPRSGHPTDLDDALYDLGDAGATAEVALESYRLGLRGTGLVELANGCRSLLAVAAGEPPRQSDEGWRPLVPGAPGDAVLVGWSFPAYMYEIPVLVFALATERTWIATRTHAETDGFPLVVKEGRDLPDVVTVPTIEVTGEARGYLRACEATARAAFPDAQLS